LESDFRQYYNINLNELAFTNKISIRRFKVLKNHLPPESAYGYFIRNKNKKLMQGYDPESISTSFKNYGKGA